MERTMSEPSAETTSSNELVRQGERTVDNLKRLFAVVFALSFGIVGNGVFGKLKAALLPPGYVAPTWLWILNIEMLVVFLVTAAVFYHQSVKFLDIRYARQPLSEAHPWGFAADYLQLVITVAPFFLMANSLGPEVTHKVGYLWFFGSYVLLLIFGLILLILSEARHSQFVRVRIWGEKIAPEEVERENSLRAYWMAMNSAVLLFLLISFWWASRSGSCPVRGDAGAPPLFLYMFGIVALLRDYLDFRFAWPFLYPMSQASAERLLKWPMTSMKTATTLKRWMLLGFAIVAADVGMLYVLRLWDFQFWISVCG
jgi:hypothetical protein